MTEKLEASHTQLRDGTAIQNGHLLKQKVTSTQEQLNTAQTSTKDGLSTMVKPEAYHIHKRDGTATPNGPLLKHQVTQPKNFQEWNTAQITTKDSL